MTGEEADKIFWEMVEPLVPEYNAKLIAIDEASNDIRARLLAQVLLKGRPLPEEYGNEQLTRLAVQYGLRFDEADHAVTLRMAAYLEQEQAKISSNQDLQEE